MDPKTPFNIKLMDTEESFHQLGMGKVSVHSMFESSTSKFHPEGLYSEEIFGEIGTKDRMYQYGYIDLKTRILHPYVYRMLMTLKRSYDGIASGRMYAIWSEESKDFVTVSKDTEGAKTGFHFFMTHLPKVDFKRTESIKRENKIKILEMYDHSILTVPIMVVSPAGIRDVQMNEDGSTTSEEINKLYLALLSLTQALPDEGSEELMLMYDSIRYSIQTKCVDIWNYLWNIFTGKRGFALSKHASRNITWGSRNVISAAKMEVSQATSSDFIKHNETVIPLYQVMKMFQPITVQKVKSIFLDPIFSLGATQLPLINQKTLKVEYVELPEKDLAMWNSVEGIVQMVDQFEDEELRNDPVLVETSKGSYYLMLIYDDGKKVSTVRDLGTFLEMNPTFKKEHVRPITFTEMFYLALFKAMEDKHSVITRYPVLEAGSTYPSRVIIGTTNPSREVKFFEQTDSDKFITIPRYPIFGNNYINSMVLHPSKLGGLGGDYDGDMVSATGVMTKEANAECKDHLSKALSFVKVDGSFQSSIGTDLTNLVLFNLTREGKSFQ